MLRKAFQDSLHAARANFLPGLLLQCLMIVFFVTYVMHEGTRQFLAQVAQVKLEAGYPFAFGSYILASALLPEILRICFFQNLRITRRNFWNFFTAAPLWGFIGILVDFFYRCQIAWFGTASDLQTVLTKMVVDQFVFSPLFATTTVVGYLTWRDERFTCNSFKRLFSWTFYWQHVFPVQVAGWCVWIPAVSLVYFMPSDLQIPVAVLIQSFWVLIITTVSERSHLPVTPAVALE